MAAAVNEDAEFLRSLAQNEYMIDQHFLPTGVRLNQIADAIDEFDEALTQIKEEVDRQIALKEEAGKDERDRAARRGRYSS
jgi:hypothetical protein